MARKPATPEQKEETRRIIRRAASDIYKHGGPGAVSVRAIAEKAGVSVGTVYGYFGSLFELFESLWTGPEARFNGDLQAIAKSVVEPAARLRALMTGYVQFSRENIDIYRGVFLYVRPLDKIEKVRKQAGESIFVSLLQSAIEDGQAKGAFKPGDPSDFAQLIWGSLHGCIALPHNFGALEFANPDQIADQMIEVLMESLKS